MTNNNAVTYNLVEETRPIKSAVVSNPKGYWDLIINKSKNGKALRISTRTGSASVNISLDKVESLVKALQDVKSRGVNTSVEELPFRAASGTSGGSTRR